DLPPLVLDDAFVTDVRQSLGELPAERRRRLVDHLGIPATTAAVVTSHPGIARFFDEALRAYATNGQAPPKQALRMANFLQSEVLRDTHTSGLDASLPVSPAQLAELLRLVDAGTISGKQAKEVYAAVV